MEAFKNFLSVVTRKRQIFRLVALLSFLTLIILSILLLSAICEIREKANKQGEIIEDVESDIAEIQKELSGVSEIVDEIKSKSISHSQIYEIERSLKSIQDRLKIY